MKPSHLRYTVYLLIFTSMLLMTPPLFAAPSANDIIKQVAKKNASPNEEAKIRMTITEPDGTKKERLIVIKKKQTKDQMALVRLLSPNDLKGVGLLTVSKGDSDNQWLYLPSEKRSRRLVGSNSKGRFLDSEISYEDLRISTYENFTNKITPDANSKNKNVVLIESVAKDADATAYGKMKTWIDTKLARVLKTEYYNPEGELLKVMTFNNYKKYNKFWRAQSIDVKNVKKNRSTTMKLEKLSTKKIDDEEFSISSLEEG
jgi:outer membrane lipoprotein-sorting protein